MAKATYIQDGEPHGEFKGEDASKSNEEGF